MVGSHRRLARRARADPRGGDVDDHRLDQLRASDRRTACGAHHRRPRRIICRKDVVATGARAACCSRNMKFLGRRICRHSRCTMNTAQRRSGFAHHVAAGIHPFRSPGKPAMPCVTARLPSATALRYSAAIVRAVSRVATDTSRSNHPAVVSREGKTDRPAAKPYRQPCVSKFEVRPLIDASTLQRIKMGYAAPALTRPARSSRTQIDLQRRGPSGIGEIDRARLQVGISMRVDRSKTGWKTSAARRQHDIERQRPDGLRVPWALPAGGDETSADGGAS